MEADLEKAKNTKLATVHLTIGKSKNLVTYTFKVEDFVRMEDNQLFLKSDERVLKLSDEQIRNLIFQCNYL